MDLQFFDKNMENVRQEDDLHGKRQDRRDVQVMRAAYITYDGGAHGKQETLQGEQMQKGVHPPLYQKAECRQKDKSGQETVDL
jgi:hypothetical protein